MSLHHTRAQHEAAPREHGDELARALRGAAAGNEHGWDVLVLRFSPMIRRVAMRHGLQAADADDVAEATWLRLVNNIQSVRDPNALVGWLTTVAHRESLRLLYRQRRESQAGLAGYAEETEDPDQLGDSLEHDEARAALDRALASLPERQRRLMQLLLADGRQSYEEIATELEMPIGSIGPTRARVLTRLRQDPKVAEALQALL